MKALNLGASILASLNNANLKRANDALNTAKAKREEAEALLPHIQAAEEAVYSASSEEEVERAEERYDRLCRRRLSLIDKATEMELRAGRETRQIQRRSR